VPGERANDREAHIHGAARELGEARGRGDGGGDGGGDVGRGEQGGDGAELGFDPGAALVDDSALSHGSLNLAQFRSGFDFLGAGLGLFLCFASLDCILLR
jgi:hypothetical protein